MHPTRNKKVFHVRGVVLLGGGYFSRPFNNVFCGESAVAAHRNQLTPPHTHNRLQRKELDSSGHSSPTSETGIVRARFVLGEEYCCVTGAAQAAVALFLYLGFRSFGRLFQSNMTA